MLVISHHKDIVSTRIYIPFRPALHPQPVNLRYCRPRFSGTSADHSSSQSRVFSRRSDPSVVQE
jgi:hypothetical protein